MNKDSDNTKFEQRIRFVAKRYRKDSLDAEKAWHRFASAHGIRKTVHLWRYIWSAAAVFLVLVGISVFYIRDTNATEWVVISSDTGEQKEVILPDSSRIFIAESTTIRYDKKNYGKEKRVVEMNGKAFFEVQRDETRSFSVQTEQAEVKVLGTSFQLQESAGLTIVRVETGKVSFTAGKDKRSAVLTAGMSANYTEENGISIDQEDKDDNYLSWKTRQLRFRNTPLEKVISDVSDMYKVRVVSTTDIPSGLELTSYFNDMSLEEVLTVINQTLDIQLKATTR